MPNFLFAKDYRPIGLNQRFWRKRFINQTDWPVIFGITGPICARALKSKIHRKLGLRGHHDWPVMPTMQDLKSKCRKIETSVRASPSHAFLVNRAFSATSKHLFGLLYFRRTSARMI